MQSVNTFNARLLSLIQVSSAAAYSKCRWPPLERPHVFIFILLLIKFSCSDCLMILDYFRLGSRLSLLGWLLVGCYILFR